MMSSSENNLKERLPSGIAPSSVDYCCPYDTCTFTAPTERQVRAHITWADHGEHEGTNGFSVAVDIPDTEGTEHEFVNQIQLDDVTLADITDEVNAPKQMILKLAYECPTGSYTEIHEEAEAQGIEYSYNVVRKLIQKFIEHQLVEQETDSSHTQTVDSADSDEDAEPFTFGTSVDAVDPLTATPNSISTTTSADTQPDTTNDKSATTISEEETEDADEHNPPSDDSGADNMFPYDTSTIADYWNTTERRIIATYRALDDPTYADVHERLTDLGIDISESYVGSTLSGWRTGDYEELTETQQQAVDLLTNMDNTSSLQQIADQSELSLTYLKGIRQFYPHIIEKQDGSVPWRKIPDGDELPFEVRDDLDDETWSRLDRIIISAYHALETPTNPDVYELLVDNDVDVAQSTVQVTLSDYVDADRRKQQLTNEEKAYNDLNTRQQAAVDAIVKHPPDVTIRDIATHTEEDEHYLYYINQDFGHIIETRREEI